MNVLTYAERKERAQEVHDAVRARVKHPTWDACYVAGALVIMWKIVNGRTIRLQFNARTGVFTTQVNGRGHNTDSIDTACKAFTHYVEEAL